MLSFVSISARAQTPLSPVKAYNISICPIWKYDTKVMGHVCMNPTNVVLPDGYSVRDTVSELEAKISALEARIKALEEKQ